MTKIVLKKMYCENCKEYFEVPVYYSLNMMLAGKEENKKLKDGTLFKNICPKCQKELIEKK